MPDVLAIVSKAVFEKEAAGLGPGQVWPIDRYRSENKHLAQLASGGRLLLVTVRPPKEALWLVAVLESPVMTGKEWCAKPNRVPITDVTALRKRIRFASGKGIEAAPGALGMSLQTPRALTPSAAERLLAKAQRSLRPKGPINVTKHEPDSPLPCLCGHCLPGCSDRAAAGGMSFVRASSEAAGRRLYYWMPEELSPVADAVNRSVRGALAARMAARR